MDDELAKNLLAIWQSELTAMAADRELRETWVALVRLWAQTASASAALWPHDSTAGSSVSAQPPGPAAPDAASGPGLDEISRLNRRVSELERDLAELRTQRRQPAPPPGDDQTA